MFAGFRKQLAELSQSTLMIYLNNLLPMYIENFFISKRLLEKQAKDSQKKIAKIFKAEFSNVLDMNDEDDIRYSNYDKFKRMRMLEKPNYDLFKTID